MLVKARGASGSAAPATAGARLAAGPKALAAAAYLRKFRRDKIPPGQRGICAGFDSCNLMVTSFQINCLYSDKITWMKALRKRKKHGTPPRRAAAE
jgi:hypothetical protein